MDKKVFSLTGLRPPWHFSHLWGYISSDPLTNHVHLILYISVFAWPNVSEAGFGLRGIKRPLGVRVISKAAEAQ